MRRAARRWISGRAKLAPGSPELRQTPRGMPAVGWNARLWNSRAAIDEAPRDGRWGTKGLGGLDRRRAVHKSNCRGEDRATDPTPSTRRRRDGVPLWTHWLIYAQAEEDMDNIKHLLLVGCGTSMNASLYGAKLMRDLGAFDTAQVMDASRS